MKHSSPLYRVIAPFLFVLVFLLSGCGGHGGGHASARDKALRLMKRGVMSGKFDEEARGTSYTTFNLYLSSGSGVAAFNNYSSTSSYSRIYRADVSNVQWNPSPTDDSVGTVTLTLTNFSAEAPFAGEAAFTGSYKLDDRGLRLTGGSISGKFASGNPYRVIIDAATVGDPSATEFADPHYAGTIEPPLDKTNLSWDGAITRIDDAHVRVRIASTLGTIDCEAADTKGVLMGEFDGAQIDYAGRTGQLFLTQVDGVVYGVYHLYDPRGSTIGAGNIYAQKGTQASTVTSGYYEGTMTRGSLPSGLPPGDQPKAASLTIPVKMAISPNSEKANAVLFTPQAKAVSYAGGATFDGGTITVKNLTGYYKSIVFVKTNNSTLAMSGTYRAFLASDSSVEVGTFSVSVKTPPASLAYVTGSLKGLFKSSVSGSSSEFAGHFALGTDDPAELTITAESGPGLTGYYVGNDFAASDSNSTLRISGTLSGTGTVLANGYYEKVGSAAADHGSFSLAPYVPDTGGGSDVFSTGLYSGTLTKDNSTLARPLRLDVLHNSATEGKNGAAIVLSGRTANPNVGGRVVSVSGDNKAVTVTVKEFTALYLRAYFNGTVVNGVFSGTYSLIGAKVDDTESGTFTTNLNANPTHPYFAGLWSGTFGGAVTSTGTVRIVEGDDEVALVVVDPATYDGYTVHLVTGYSVDGFLEGHTATDPANTLTGDFSLRLNAAGNHFDGSAIYSGGDGISHYGAFNGDRQ